MKDEGRGKLRSNPLLHPSSFIPHPSPVVGVLCLQGDFREHIEKLRSLGASTKDVRHVSDLDEIDGLIIPGGESTAVAIVEKSDAAHGIFEKIQELSSKGL